MAISGASSNITKSSNSIELYQGESKDIDVVVVQEVEDVNGVPVEEPVDLFGAVLYFSVRSKASAPELLIGKDSLNPANIEIVPTPTNGDPPPGLAIIHLVPLDTRNMQSGEYVFDVWVVFASGKSFPVIEISEFILKEPVTKLP